MCLSYKTGDASLQTMRSLCVCYVTLMTQDIGLTWSVCLSCNKYNWRRLSMRSLRICYVTLMTQDIRLSDPCVSVMQHGWMKTADNEIPVCLLPYTDDTRSCTHKNISMCLSCNTWDRIPDKEIPTYLLCYIGNTRPQIMISLYMAIMNLTRLPQDHKYNDSHVSILFQKVSQNTEWSWHTCTCLS